MFAFLTRLFEKLLAPPAPPAAQRAASQAPAQEPTLRANKVRTPAEMKQREDMIAQAMAIQKSKQHVFDQLDPLTRQKLTAEAFEKLGNPRIKSGGQSLPQNQGAKPKPR
jgi:hypothetical protein